MPSMHQIDLEIRQVFFLFSPLLPDPFALPILEKKLESLFGGYIVPILKLCFFLILPSFSSVPIVVVLFESTTLLHSFFFLPCQ